MADSKNPYQNAVDASLPVIGNPGGKAIVVTDFHSVMDKTHSYAFGLAKATGKVVGLEMISVAEEAIIRAFEDKTIERSDFVALMKKNFDTSAIGPKAYMDESRAYLFYEDMAQNIQDGVKIRAAGTYAGTSVALTNTENVRLFTDYKTLDVLKDIEAQKFFSKNKEELEKNPQALFKRYIAEIDGRREMLGERGRADLADLLNADAKGEFKTDEDYRGCVYSLFHAQSPYTEKINELATQWHRVEKQVKEQDIDIQSMREAVDYTTSEIGAKLVKDNNGAIILYGRAHTTHGKRDGFDLDQGLRDAGIETVVLDPRLPADEMVPGHLSLQYKRDMLALLADNDRNIQLEKDPNRYSVDLNGGRVVPADQPMTPTVKAVSKREPEPEEKKPAPALATPELAMP